MRTAIRKHLLDFLAIIGLLIIAIVVATVILGKQRLALPAWVPIVGQDFFVIEAEMSTAQAVTPGQGQTVNVAGVEVGEIASVKLRDGKAIIGMKIQPRYATVYKDASVLLRPKTGLKDMVAELTPGTKEAGRLEEGAVIPVSQTLPDVNLDEILAALDADTRDYLRAAAQRRRRRASAPRQKGRELAQAIRRLEPTAKYAREINEGLALRRRNLARVVHNFSLLTDELGQRDTQLANFVQNSNAVFDTLAGPGRVAAAILQKLPGTLQTTQETLGKVDTFARGARADARVAAAGGARARPVAAPDAAVPARVDADHPRRDPPVHARGAADGQGAAARRCATWRRSTPDLTASFKVVNRLLNTVAYNPPGDKRGGLPLLAVVGQPRRQRDLLHRRRARADPARPGRAVVQQRAAAGRGRGRPTRSWARSSSCSTRPRRQQICPQSTAPPGERRHRWLRTLPPSARSPRWCCSRCRASGCCCSCGWPSAARCR